MSKEQARITWIDMAKGYGILFVIIGHLGESFLRNEFYTFHMPLFFFLSGCVFSASKYNFKEFLLRKVQTILIPYMALGIPMILYTYWEMYSSYQRNINDYINVAKSFIIQRRMWTLWFIACLFFLEILFYLFVKLVKDNYIKLGLITVILTVAGLLYYKAGGGPLPWNVDVCLTGISFFYVGYLFKNIHQIQDILFRNKLRIVNLILFLVLNLVCGAETVRIAGAGLEMYESRYGFAPLTFIAAFAGIFFVIIFSYSIDMKPIRYIGKNSLVYYAWHQTILIPIIEKVYKELHIFQFMGFSKKLYFIKMGTSLVIICIVLTALDFIIRHTKLRFMVGQKVSFRRRKESLN
ncbi:acyltransferase family protein [Anaerocolumna sedimenticola]|uniref:Acyltransferase family protein n=1 Tax=Anaerocolumna sedimenticola TaxID=2696063 RepID=A0A6P1TIT4_9FIRM|nr:acyltransferase family protein [Anaerocolumna sedimenticola]QHQ59951.1 acyltransferase family protein [Anaerocolumna sedimenticola]